MHYKRSADFISSNSRVNLSLEYFSCCDVILHAISHYDIHYFSLFFTGCVPLVFQVILALKWRGLFSAFTGSDLYAFFVCIACCSCNVSQLVNP